MASTARARPLSVPCERCGAAYGFGCRDVTGRPENHGAKPDYPMGIFHAVRICDAIMALDKETPDESAH